MKDKVHFSFVEVLIMAVILGLAARSVAPKLAKASAEEKVCELVDGLQKMRACLDLYRAEHKEKLPPLIPLSSFETALTKRMGQCGPYVKKIPVNPFNNLSTVRFDGEPAGTGQAGWRLDTKTGLFQADNDTAYAAL